MTLHSASTSATMMAAASPRLDILIRRARASLGPDARVTLPARSSSSTRPLAACLVTWGPRSARSVSRLPSGLMRWKMRPRAGLSRSLQVRGAFVYDETHMIFVVRFVDTRAV